MSGDQRAVSKEGDWRGRAGGAVINLSFCASLSPPSLYLSLSQARFGSGQRLS
jgi:hypothetical protein